MRNQYKVLSEKYEQVQEFFSSRNLGLPDDFPEPKNQYRPTDQEMDAIANWLKSKPQYKKTLDMAYSKAKLKGLDKPADNLGPRDPVQITEQAIKELTHKGSLTVYPGMDVGGYIISHNYTQYFIKDKAVFNSTLEDVDQAVKETYDNSSNREDYLDNLKSVMDNIRIHEAEYLWNQATGALGQEYIDTISNYLPSVLPKTSNSTPQDFILQMFSVLVKDTLSRSIRVETVV